MNDQPPVYERVLCLRRQYRPHYRMARGLVDPIALANVILLFFLFFIVSSSFVIRPGITVNLPASLFTGGAQYSSLVVTISQEGMIFFNDDRTTLEGLSSAFAQAAYERPGATLVIEADGRVPHSMIVDIYNKAVAAGIREVALATRITAAETPP